LRGFTAAQTKTIQTFLRKFYISFPRL
jgi:hypothetical protein